MVEGLDVKVIVKTIDNTQCPEAVSGDPAAGLYRQGTLGPPGSLWGPFHAPRVEMRPLHQYDAWAEVAT